MWAKIQSKSGYLEPTRREPSIMFSKACLFLGGRSAIAKNSGQADNTGDLETTAPSVFTSSLIDTFPSVIFKSGNRISSLTSLLLAYNNISGRDLITMSIDKDRKFNKISSPFGETFLLDWYRWHTSWNRLLTDHGVRAESPKRAWSRFSKSLSRASDPLCFATKATNDAAKLTGKTSFTWFNGWELRWLKLKQYFSLEPEDELLFLIRAALASTSLSNKSVSHTSISESCSNSGSETTIPSICSPILTGKFISRLLSKEVVLKFEHSS